MSSIIPDVQILDQNDVWQSAITDLMSCQIDGGLAPGASKPSVGRCELIWRNASQVYNPDPSGGTAALLRARRRIRVKATTANQGNILEVTHNGAYGVGGVEAITASGQDLPIGNQSGLNYEQAQTLLLNAGWLYQIIIAHGPNTGTPTGTVTWTLYKDAGGRPSTTVVDTGTYTPTASADNTITPTGLQIDEVLYWLHLKPTAAQTSGNYWTWQASTSSAYADGSNAYTTDGGGSWTVQTAVDCQCSVEMTPFNVYVYQDVTRAVGAGEVWTLTFDARMQFDNYCSQLYAYLATTAEYQFLAGGAVSRANSWSSYSFVFTTAIGGAAYIRAGILPYFTGAGKNSTTLELRNISLVKTGEGVNVLTNGNFAGGVVSPWVSTFSSSPAPSSNTLAVIRDYRILFNGKINRIEPAPFQRAGAMTCRVLAVDFVEGLQRKRITGLALQKNQRGDQLVTTVLALLQSNNPRATLPGRYLDTGKQVFPYAFDGYTKSASLYDVITDCAVSEYGLWWIDPDGTLRWSARDFVPKQVAAAAKLTLAGGAATSSGGDPFQMMIAQDAGLVINKTALTWHPRKTASTGVVLGQITSPVSIPPVQAGGVAGEYEVTLTYRDPATQKICGGENMITPLVATTDYLIYDNATGTGWNYTTNSHFSLELVSVDASQITIKLKNTATGTLYATKLQVRGDALVSYDPQTVTYQDDTAIALDDESAWSKDLPFNDDSNFATALGEYLVNRFKTPFDTVEWVSVDWRATIGGVDVLSIAPMDVLAISDVQTALYNAIFNPSTGHYTYYPVKHLMTHWNYQFTPQGADYLGSVTWGLERVDDANYLVLDDVDYGRIAGMAGGFINHLFI